MKGWTLGQETTQTQSGMIGTSSCHPHLRAKVVSSLVGKGDGGDCRGNHPVEVECGHDARVQRLHNASLECGKGLADPTWWGQGASEGEYIGKMTWECSHRNFICNKTCKTIYMYCRSGNFCCRVTNNTKNTNIPQSACTCTVHACLPTTPHADAGVFIVTSSAHLVHCWRVAVPHRPSPARRCQSPCA